MKPHAPEYTEVAVKCPNDPYEPPKVTVICAWCGKLIDEYENPRRGAVKDIESHGLCAECKRVYFDPALDEDR